MPRCFRLFGGTAAIGHVGRFLIARGRESVEERASGKQCLYIHNFEEAVMILPSISFELETRT
jgi:hypothetical protein